MKHLYNFSRLILIIILSSAISILILIQLINNFPFIFGMNTTSHISSQVGVASTNYDPIQLIESISSQAIDTASKTLQTIQFTITAFIISLLSIATTIALSFSISLRESSNKIVEIGNKYEIVSQELEKAHRQFESLTNKYLNLQQDFISMESQVLPIDLASKAFENGRISREKYIESQVWLSWQKWKFGEDETGYKELQIHKKTLGNLPRPIKRSALAELIDIEERIKLGSSTAKDNKNETKLKKILNLSDK